MACLRREPRLDLIVRDQVQRQFSDHLERRGRDTLDRREAGRTLPILAKKHPTSQVPRHTVSLTHWAAEKRHYSVHLSKNKVECPGLESLERVNLDFVHLQEILGLGDGIRFYIDHSLDSSVDDVSRALKTRKRG